MFNIVKPFCAVLCCLVLFGKIWNMSKYVKFTDAQRRANDKYFEKLDSFSIRTTKEHGQAIRDAAARAGVSLNQFVLDAINKKLENESTDT